jgi:membrane-bound serine protease (ClpP class)
MTSAFVVVALLVLGLGLIAVELLVLPGVGLIGLLGVAGLIGAFVLAYSELPPTFAALAITGGLVAAGLAFWLLPKTRVGRSMVLNTQVTGNAADPGLAELVGREGVSITPLRPSGSVEIDDAPVDVVTDGEYVDPGKRIKVVKVEGSRVVVAALD